MVRERTGYFTKFPNDLLESIIAAKLPAPHMQVLLALVRKTAGFHRDESQLSLGYLELLTGRHRNTIRKAVNDLVDEGVVIRTRNASYRRAAKYQLNRDPSTWGRYSVDPTKPEEPG